MTEPYYRIPQELHARIDEALGALSGELDSAWWNCWWNCNGGTSAHAAIKAQQEECHELMRIWAALVPSEDETPNSEVDHE